MIVASPADRWLHRPVSNGPDPGRVRRLATTRLVTVSVAVVAIAVAAGTRADHPNRSHGAHATWSTPDPRRPPLPGTGEQGERGEG